MTRNKTTPYDYFSVKIPKTIIDGLLKSEKDERYIYFLKYGTLRRFEGDGDILFVEVNLQLNIKIDIPNSEEISNI